MPATLRQPLNVTSKPCNVPPDPDGTGDDKFRIIFNSVNDGIFICDPETGRFLDVNEAGCRMFGFENHELIGLDIEALSSGVHPFTQQEAVKQLAGAASGEPQTLEWQCKTKDGRLFWSEISIRGGEFADGPVVVSIVRDISERKRLNEEMKFIAQHDVLTGLANRLLFARELNNAIDDAKATSGKLALLYLDVDHFKDVNDTLGHPIGDELLRCVAARLLSGVRPTNVVARFGGDEFAILAPGIQEPFEVAALAERLLKLLGEPYSINGNEVHVGASIGIAVGGSGSFGAEVIFSQADIALYNAKAAGRHRYCFFTHAMDDEVRSRVKVLGELHAAISGDQLFNVYQPQFDAGGAGITGVEALVRWRHPERGIVLPDEFIGVAENNGLIEGLTGRVLSDACRQMRNWLDAGIASEVMAVNVSSVLFNTPGQLEQTVYRTLADTGLPAHLLELEITENTLMNRSGDLEAVLGRLRANGVRIAIDDFGTGYSSLSRLRYLSVDRIKIAKQFIDELATRPKDAAVVKAIITLGRALGIGVIAEGVETCTQASLLKNWGCPDIQGFHFSAPIPAEEMSLLLARQQGRVPHPSRLHRGRAGRHPRVQTVR